MRSVTVGALALAVLGIQPSSRGLTSRAPSVVPPVVGLRLLIDDTTPGNVRVQVGDRTTISPIGKATIALSPIDHGTSIELVVSAVTAGSDGEETNKELAWLALKRGTVAKVEAEGMGLEVEWTELIPGADDSPREFSGPCTQCCVLCNGIWFCACFVETTCGGCCCPEACACSTARSSSGSQELTSMACSARTPASPSPSHAEKNVPTD